MRKRFHKSSLLKFLGHEAVSEEVLHSHAYKKVESKDGSSVRPRHPYSASKKTVASYRDSMIGSIAQYHDVKPILSTKPPEQNENNNDDIVLGNRPQAKSSSPSSKDKADIERRHHFIEPPKRGFNRFN